MAEEKDTTLNHLIKELQEEVQIMEDELKKLHHRRELLKNSAQAIELLLKKQR